MSTRALTATLLAGLLAGGGRAYAQATPPEPAAAATAAPAATTPAAPATPPAAKASARAMATSSSQTRGGPPAGGGLPESIPIPADQPLPEWKPRPYKLTTAPVFMNVAPQLQSAERARSAGLFLASIGGASLLAAGITYVYAGRVNEDLSFPPDGRFHPEVEDRRNSITTAAVALFAVGGALLVSGAVSFFVGQAHIRKWHRVHPKDPLPALSGYQ